jgi:hypothetical protein
MTDRIAQLERLVTSLVDNNKTAGASDIDRVSPQVTSMLPQSPARPAPGDAANLQTPRHCGQIKVANQQTTYVSGTHWSVILEEVMLNIYRKMQ